MHVLGPILWAVVVYTGAGVLHVLDVPVLHVVLTGLGTCALAPLVAIHKRFAFLLMLATTALLTWTTATTPLQPNPAYAAAGGGVLFGLAYRALRKHEKVEDEDKTATDAARSSKYTRMLAAVGAKGFEEARRVPFPAGKTIVLRKPVKGGWTINRLKDLIEPLETAAARADLDVTFDFEVSQTSRAEVLLHVFERDVLAETIPYPFDRSAGAASIHQAVPLGQFPTGEPADVVFREVAALLVGIKGKGKSNMINVHLVHFTRCPDAVVWLLDGKGTRTVGPWIESYLRGETDRPAIDWPAVTDAEFDYVLMATKAVVKYRSRHTSGEKVHPTPDLPAVITIVEEASTITGVTRRGAAPGVKRVELLQDGVVQGRSEGCDWMIASQRATVTMVGGGDMKSNLDLRYGLGVTDEHDARSIFSEGKFGRALLALGKGTRYRGVFLMEGPDSDRVMPAKSYRIEPEAIPGMASHNSRYAGTLDPETADFVHAELLRQGVPGGYYGRWDRIRKALGRDSETSQPVSQESVSRPAETSHAGETRETSQGAETVLRAVSEAREKRETERLNAEFERLVSGLREGETPAETVPQNIPPVLRLTLAVFEARDLPEALPSQLLCELLPGDLNVTSLGRLMGQCNVSPGEIRWEGKRARGYRRDDVETAIKRGSWLPVAFDWEP